MKMAGEGHIHMATSRPNRPRAKPTIDSYLIHYLYRLSPDFFKHPVAKYIPLMPGEVGGYDNSRHHRSLQ